MHAWLKYKRFRTDSRFKLKFLSWNITVPLRNIACVSHYHCFEYLPIYVTDDHGPDFDDMSSFFPCEIDDGIQYIHLGYGAQAPKIFYSEFLCYFLLFWVLGHFCNFRVTFLPYIQGLHNFKVIFLSFPEFSGFCSSF